MGWFEGYVSHHISSFNQTHQLHLLSSASSPLNDSLSTYQPFSSSADSSPPYLVEWSLVDLATGVRHTRLICPTLSCELLSVLYLYSLQWCAWALVLLLLGYVALILICFCACQLLCLCCAGTRKSQQPASVNQTKGGAQKPKAKPQLVEVHVNNFQPPPPVPLPPPPPQPPPKAVKSLPSAPPLPSPLPGETHDATKLANPPKSNIKQRPPPPLPPIELSGGSTETPRSRDSVFVIQRPRPPPPVSPRTPRFIPLTKSGSRSPPLVRFPYSLGPPSAAKSNQQHHQSYAVDTPNEDEDQGSPVATPKLPPTPKLSPIGSDTIPGSQRLVQRRVRFVHQPGAGAHHKPSSPGAFVPHMMLEPYLDPRSKTIVSSDGESLQEEEGEERSKSSTSARATPTTTTRDHRKSRHLKLHRPN